MYYRKNKSAFNIIFFAMFLTPNLAFSDVTQNCQNWFDAFNIPTDIPECLPFCNGANVGLGTFSCPTQCPHLCFPCDLSELTPLTDPEAIAFENGARINTGSNFNLNTQLNCLTQEITNLGGNSILTSAYRPASYQQHLREVYLLHERSITNTQVGCNQLKVEIEREFSDHALVEIPARSSSHSTGNAFDLRVIGLTDQQIDTAAQSCNLRRPLPVRDPVHFTP